MDWESFHDPLVGRGAHFCRFCNILLDPHTHPVLHECESFLFSPHSRFLTHCQTWYLAHFPMFGNQPYDRFGKSYKVTRVLTTDDTFNMTAYEEYSPLYLPAAFAMTYLLAFALSTCVIVHTLLYHGRTLLNGFKRMRLEEDDIHLKLMQNYPEVPDWWYLSAFVFFFSLSIVAVEVCPLTSSPKCSYAKLYTQGLAHGRTHLGTTSLCFAADHLCASVRLCLRHDGSSGALT